MFEDVISGKTFERTGLADLFDHLRPGDTLAVVRLDRLGRSLRELLDVVEDLQKREVALLSLEEKLARAKGSRPGRPPLNPDKLEAALLLVKGGMSPTKAARRTALGRSTLYREIQARDHA